MRTHFLTRGVRVRPITALYVASEGVESTIMQAYSALLQKYGCDDGLFATVGPKYLSKNFYYKGYEWRYWARPDDFLELEGATLDSAVYIVDMQDAGFAFIWRTEEGWAYGACADAYNNPENYTGGQEELEGYLRAVESPSFGITQVFTYLLTGRIE